MKTLLALALMLLACTACEFSTDINAKNIKGYDFSLFEVQEYCTVKRQGKIHLTLACTKKKLRPVMTACEGLLTAGLKDPNFYCSGGLWMLSKKCYIQMLDIKSGNLRCKKES